MRYIKHEIVSCERCGVQIECRANAYTRCQCSVVSLSIREVEYISERHDGCLCSSCLRILKEEFQQEESIIHDFGREN